MGRFPRLRELYCGLLPHDDRRKPARATELVRDADQHPRALDLYHHNTLFRLKPGITLERIRRAREELSRLVETLPGVVDFTVTDNLAEHSQGYTLALFSTFESAGACQICQRHPDYQRVWAELLMPVVEDWIVAEGAGE